MSPLLFSQHNVTHLDVRRTALKVTRSVLQIPLGASLFEAFLRGFADNRTTIFMVHRFADPSLGSTGTRPEVLESVLATLRRLDVEFAPLSSVIADSANVERSRCPKVIFTVDDGYLDFSTVAAPLFREFDCPVTVFLSTGVISNSAWYWWDRVEYIMLTSRRLQLDVSLPGFHWRTALGDALVRREGSRILVERLKSVPDSVRREFLDMLAVTAGVEVPVMPPEMYRTLSWSDVRSLELRGVEFGPHSMTHPILSTVSESVARAEIIGSWREIRAQCANPVPIFCYPNGTEGSFSGRDEALVREAGLIGAVSYIRGRVSSPVNPFRLPRLELGTDSHATGAVVCGWWPP